jgi:hypothetical protein
MGMRWPFPEGKAAVDGSGLAEWAGNGNGQGGVRAANGNGEG